MSAPDENVSSTSVKLRGNFLRWLKFNAVGAVGVVVQLCCVFALRSCLHWNYLLATVVAVELTVIHNFIWHERYTWADRVRPSWRESLPRFVRFNLSNGGVSILGNLVLMALLAGWLQLNYLAANVVAIVLCSIVNFLFSKAWVFTR